MKCMIVNSQNPTVEKRAINQRWFKVGINFVLQVELLKFLLSCQVRNLLHIFMKSVFILFGEFLGHYEIGGLWPAMWLLGNLARATYVGSSNNIWPWSFDECDTALQPQQLISACNIVNHFRLHSRQGRGAPEIDILEAMAGVEDLQNTDTKRPYYSASLQVRRQYVLN